MAERRHASREPSQLEMTAYETMLHRLRLDKARLSRVQSQKAKELLPDNQPWIEGVLTADSGQSDDVLTTVMIWCCDCGNIAEALRIGQYVLRHK